MRLRLRASEYSTHVYQKSFDAKIVSLWNCVGEHIKDVDESYRSLCGFSSSVIGHKVMTTLFGSCGTPILSEKLLYFGNIFRKVLTSENSLDRLDSVVAGVKMIENCPDVNAKLILKTDNISSTT